MVATAARASVRNRSRHALAARLKIAMMRLQRCWMFGLLLMGCDAFSDLRVEPRSRADILDVALGQDLAGADLTSPQPPCLAAKGIAGTLLKEQKSGNVFCVDFDQSGLTDATLTAAGWNLTAATSGCGGFTVTGARLTIKAPMAMATPKCEAKMPALVVGKDTQKVYVSIVHDLTFVEITQYAAVNLNNTDTQTAGWTGKNTKAPPSGILQFDSEGLNFNGFLRAQNTKIPINSELPAWSIQSIAVFGAP